MGRYAFFSTGLQQKFGFGVQPSTDMKTFGGLHRVLNQQESKVVWTLEERSNVQDALQEMLPGQTETVSQFLKAFEPSFEGTCTLKMALDDFADMPQDPKVRARFRLGCLIWHQMAQSKQLSVVYEDV